MTHGCKYGVLLVQGLPQYTQALAFFFTCTGDNRIDVPWYPIVAGCSQRGLGPMCETSARMRPTSSSCRTYQALDAEPILPGASSQHRLLSRNRASFSSTSSSLEIPPLAVERLYRQSQPRPPPGAAAFLASFDASPPSASGVRCHRKRALVQLMAQQTAAPHIPLSW
mmetsp:Transcript_19731/g.47259  ORF Transcript_19731/g.47259 Transcript_19731/m.47259 type:complete len:168 (+) Transcript_19731:148-651(+)